MNEQKRGAIYKFPPLNLLKNPHFEKLDFQKLKETASIIQRTLLNFGIRVVITDVNVGARFTRYEIQPEIGVRVRDITKRENEIRIATGGFDIHIEAPIPGKAAIGIDIANKENRIVTIREIIETSDFIESSSSLTIPIGLDVLGKPVIYDVSKMHHLLIGGTTGSGKSVFIDSMIMSIIYKARPDEVKMVMIDTKGITLSVYNGIPHLLIPVVTDIKKASAALHWGAAEMEDRYRKFADFGVRNLKEYNKKILNSEDNYGKPMKMSQILIIIDDLSDLMAVNSGEIEEYIVRLAQMSRVTGIHLVISTQRPSTNVVTGLIKANIPSRIAFSVFSAIDSRVILDEKGAEELLGKGDMLFKPIGYPRPSRIQGAHVSDREISDVVDFLRNQEIGNVYSENIEEKNKNTGNLESGKDVSLDHDPYFTEAGRFIIEKDKASIGMLQRVFKIGFNRAARIMEELCEVGVVGEEAGTKPRKILMTIEEFENKLYQIEPAQKEGSERIKANSVEEDINTKEGFVTEKLEIILDDEKTENESTEKLNEDTEESAFNNQRGAFSFLKKILIYMVLIFISIKAIPYFGIFGFIIICIFLSPDIIAIFKKITHKEKVETKEEKEQNNSK